LQGVAVVTALARLLPDRFNRIRGDPAASRLFDPARAFVSGRRTSPFLQGTSIIPSLGFFKAALEKRLFLRQALLCGALIRTRLNALY